MSGPEKDRFVQGVVRKEGVNLEYRKAITLKDGRICILRNGTEKAGASFKDAGKKCFGISLIQNAGIIRDILQRLELEAEE